MNSLVECPICKRTLEEPVLLPCSHTVCKKHERDSTTTTRNSLTCPTCRAAHDVPEQGGFLFNAIAKEFVERRFERLYLGVEHKVAVDAFLELKRLLTTTKGIHDNPDVKIHETIGELKNRIDLRREKAKEEIDQEAVGLIDEFEAFEAHLQASLAAVGSAASSHETKMLIESLENKIDVWESELNGWGTKDVKKWKNMHQEIVANYRELRVKCESIRDGLFTDAFNKLVDKQRIFCRDNFEPNM